MKPCIVIPCFNHPATVATVARAALAHAPVIVVDDGSTMPLPDLPIFRSSGAPQDTLGPRPTATAEDEPGCTVVRFDVNRGKGAALRAGLQQATADGFTHAITMDADGQHSGEDLPKFLEAARAQPDALIVGVRDFFAAGCPTHRRRSNAVSTFWFRVETGVRLPDTQCGFRCYPLALAQRLATRSGRYAFELEFMVRASWVGTAIVPVPVACSYRPEQIRQSHFRPVRDLAHITVMNIGLVLQSWFVPRTLRVGWSFGQRKTLWKTIGDFFAEHAHEPARLAAAVGLGLFFGITPIWGYQMIVAAAVAHLLRLNKAVTLLASNISIPPMLPLILYGGMALGHWLSTGQRLEAGFSPQHMTKANALEYLGQWLVGSLVLAVIVGALGTITTYVIARLVRRK